MPANSTVQATSRPRAIASVRLPSIPGWQLIRPLGSGAQSTTYMARPEGCAEDAPPDYAVKVLLPPHDQEAAAILSLRREAYVGRRVSHPHVVSVLAARVDQAPHYVVMPRLDGISLRAVLHDAGSLPCGRALWIVRKVAEGLNALHELGWIHGDVKPDNIVVSATGHVTVVDLGFVRPIHQSTNRTERALMGTLKYAAPESFVASRGEDRRSDMYSLGITLYELLTGHLPFDTVDPQHLVTAHLQQKPRNARSLVPQIPRSVNQLLKNMLAKDPIRRPQSVDELISRLVRLEIETLSMQPGL